MSYTLADLRLMHNKSYRDVCEYLKMNIRSYRSYEGRNYIPKKYLLKLLAYYNVSLNDVDLTPNETFSSRGKERKQLSFDLKRIRESLQLTQLELSEQLGISQYLISEIERLGTCKPEHYELLSEFVTEHCQNYNHQLMQIIDDLEKRVKHLEMMITSR